MLSFEGSRPQAEHLAEAERDSRDLFRLVEAYKRLEGLEARVAEVRTALPPNAPEPRVLDLPRARVLVARRIIGRAIVALDDEEEEEQ